MSFWQRLSKFLGSLGDPSFAGEQLSEAGVRALFAQLPHVHTETLQFFEPTIRTMPGQEHCIPNVLAEFRDPSVALVYGNGPGHLFLRVHAVQGIEHNLQASGYRWSALVQALTTAGYHVKHIGYYASMDLREFDKEAERIRNERSA